MTDRELLEAAAKAAAMELEVAKAEDGDWLYQAGDHPYNEWNPLTDDGDALRLAVKLRIAVYLAETPPLAPECGITIDRNDAPDWRYIGAEDSDPYAATRRAIVRAAAAIGASK